MIIWTFKKYCSTNAVGGTGNAVIFYEEENCDYHHLDNVDIHTDLPMKRDFNQLLKNYDDDLDNE